VSPLFRKSEEKRAQEAAAEAECQRLKELPVADLAALILPAFAADQRSPANGWINAGQWVMADYAGGAAAKAVQQLRTPLTAAIEALEHAGLLERDRSNIGSTSRLKTTVLGERALADNSARSYL
jgi:hypothetical protein